MRILNGRIINIKLSGRVYLVRSGAILVDQSDFFLPFRSVCTGSVQPGPFTAVFLVRHAELAFPG